MGAAESSLPLPNQQRPPLPLSPSAPGVISAAQSLIVGPAPTQLTVALVGPPASGKKV